MAYKRLTPINTEVEIQYISYEKGFERDRGIVLAETSVGIELNADDFWHVIPWNNVRKITYSIRPDNEFYKYPEDQKDS